MIAHTTAQQSPTKEGSQFRYIQRFDIQDPPTIRSLQMTPFPTFTEKSLIIIAGPYVNAVSPADLNQLHCGPTYACGLRNDIARDCNRRLWTFQMYQNGRQSLAYCSNATPARQCCALLDGYASASVAFDKGMASSSSSPYYGAIDHCSLFCIVSGKCIKLWESSRISRQHVGDALTAGQLFCLPRLRLFPYFVPETVYFTSEYHREEDLLLLL